MSHKNTVQRPSAPGTKPGINMVASKVLTGGYNTESLESVSKGKPNVEVLLDSLIYFIPTNILKNLGILSGQVLCVDFFFFFFTKCELFLNYLIPSMESQHLNSPTSGSTLKCIQGPVLLWVPPVSPLWSLEMLTVYMSYPALL